MDTRTGQIYELQDGQSLRELADSIAKLDRLKRKVSEVEADLVRLKNKPDPKCWRCHGTGRIPKGNDSRRFKPCKCTEKGAT